MYRGFTASMFDIYHQITTFCVLTQHTTFIDNFFSTPRLFDDLDRCKIISCGTVQPNRKDMPSDFGLQNNQLENR